MATLEQAQADLPIKEFGALGGGADLFDAEALFDTDFFEAAPPPAGGSQIRYWTGSAWALGSLKRWNGTAWVDATLQRWSGAAWVSV